MKAQDIVILIKTLLLGEEQWRYCDLARMLQISQSEVHAAIQRSVKARLFDPISKKPFRKALLDFILYGLKFVFPASPGPIVRGIPTAHSCAPISSHILSNADNSFVWKSNKGKIKGQEIDPLYPSIVNVVKDDKELHQMLALIDALRIGNSREQSFAKEELEKRILGV